MKIGFYFSKCKITSGLVVIFCLLIILPGRAYANNIHLLYMAQSGYQPSEILERVDSFEKQFNVFVTTEFVEYEELYKRILDSAMHETGYYDVILIDLIWTADFAEKKIIEPLSDSTRKTLSTRIVPEIFDAFKYDGEVWAYPFLADFQLLFVNMRMLNELGYQNPPGTLEELVEIAKLAKKMGIVKYPVFDSWKKQEALVCEFVWYTGAFGGDLTDNTDKINITTEPSIQALTFMVSLMEQGLINPYSLDSDELFSGEVFLNEDCLFTTNWTYLSGLISNSPLPISQYGVPALIPVSQKISKSDKMLTSVGTSSISGFCGLSVAGNSRDKESSWELVRYLASEDFQREHLNEMSVWKKVWEEPETRIKDPYIDLKIKQISGVHNRPLHKDYIKISKILQNYIDLAISGVVNPVEALEKAQAEIDNLIKND